MNPTNNTLIYFLTNFDFPSTFHFGSSFIFPTSLLLPDSWLVFLERKTKTKKEIDANKLFKNENSRSSTKVHCDRIIYCFLWKLRRVTHSLTYLDEILQFLSWLESMKWVVVSYGHDQFYFYSLISSRLYHCRCSSLSYSFKVSVRKNWLIAYGLVRV